MKKKMILLTLLVLLVSMIIVPAGAVSNISCQAQRDGSVQVSFSDYSGSGPYEVHYSLPYWDNRNYYEDGFRSSPAKVLRMIPGATYEVWASKAGGYDASESTTFTVPKSTFTDWKSGKSVRCTLETFDARTESIYKTFQVQLHYPRLSKTRRYTWMLALWTPEGYCGETWLNEYCTFEPRYAYLYWDLDLSDWMDSVEKCFGKILGGRYVFEMYLDGQYYGGAEFFVYN